VGRHEGFLSERDRQILKRVFRVSEPETLPKLLSAVPATKEIPVIEFFYNERPKGGRKRRAPHVLCAFKHGARHWRGYVMKYRNGSRILVGIKCGAHHFGLDFYFIEETFKSARSRQRDLVRLLALRKLIPAAKAEVLALPEHPAVAAFDGFRDRLTAEFHALANSLSRFATTGGRLISTKFKRDIGAEEKRAERMVPSLFRAVEAARAENLGQAEVSARVAKIKDWMGRQSPIETSVDVDLGPCFGVQLFLEQSTARLLANRASAALRKALRPFQEAKSEGLSGARLATATSALRSAVAQVRELQELLREVEQFTEWENAKRVEGWSRVEAAAARDPLPYHVLAQGGTLVRADNGTALRVDVGYSVPVLSALDAIEEALGIEVASSPYRRRGKTGFRAGTNRGYKSLRGAGERHNPANAYLR
jgi:hypothetical protein